MPNDLTKLVVEETNALIKQEQDERWTMLKIMVQASGAKLT